MVQSYPKLEHSVAYLTTRILEGTSGQIEGNLQKKLEPELYNAQALYRCLGWWTDFCPTSL
eukprot:2594757-Amphidinium_carterae.1